MADAKPERQRSKPSDGVKRRSKRTQAKTPAGAALLDRFVAAKLLGRKTNELADEWGIPVGTLYQLTSSDAFRDEFARARAERMESARAMLEEAAQVAVVGLMKTITEDAARRPEACAQILDRVGLPRLVRTASTSVQVQTPAADPGQPTETGGVELRTRSQEELERFLATGSWEPAASTG